jgi:hypothetical protein
MTGSLRTGKDLVSQLLLVGSEYKTRIVFVAITTGNRVEVTKAIFLNNQNNIKKLSEEKYKRYEIAYVHRTVRGRP